MGFTDRDFEYIKINEDNTISLKNENPFEQFSIELTDEEKNIIKELYRPAVELYGVYSEVLERIKEGLSNTIKNYNDNITTGKTGLDVVDRLGLRILNIQAARKNILKLRTTLEMEKENLKKRLAVEKSSKAKKILKNRLKHSRTSLKNLRVVSGGMKGVLKDIKPISSVIAGAKSPKTVNNIIVNLSADLADFSGRFATLKKLLLNGKAKSKRAIKLEKELSNNLKKGKVARGVAELEDWKSCCDVTQPLPKKLNDLTLNLVYGACKSIKNKLRDRPEENSFTKVKRKFSAIFKGIRAIRSGTLKQLDALLDRYGVKESRLREKGVWCVRVEVRACINENKCL